MPQVSVIIPTYNRSNVLSRSIESVLNQSLEDIELIIVNDSSDDETAELVSQYNDNRIHYFEHEKNKGGSAARNTGINIATGNYIAFLDDDDEWMANKLERQVNELKTRSEDWIAAYCGVQYVEDGDRTQIISKFSNFFPQRKGFTGREGGKELQKSILAGKLNTSAGSTLIVDSDIAKETQFDESFKRYQDTEFLVNVLSQGKLAFVPTPLTKRYISTEPDLEPDIDNKVHLLNEFSEIVFQSEFRQESVLARHHLEIAKKSIKNRKYRKGLYHLYRSGLPNIVDVPGLAFSLISGLTSKSS